MSCSLCISISSFSLFQIWPTQLLSGGNWDFLHSSSCQMWVSQSAQHPSPSPPVLAFSTATVCSGFGKWTFVLVHWTESTRLALGRQGEAKGHRDCPMQQHPGTEQHWTRNSYAMWKGRESKFPLHPRSGAGRTMFGVVVQLWRFLFSRGQEL